MRDGGCADELMGEPGWAEEPPWCEGSLSAQGNVRNAKSEDQGWADELKGTVV